MKKEDAWFFIMMATALVLSTVFPASKYGVETIPPTVLSFFRLFFASAFLWLYLRRRTSLAPKKKHWRAAAAIGALTAVSMLTQNYGLTFSTSANASILVNSSPILSAMLASLFLGEVVGKRKWAGIALGFIGVVTVVIGTSGIGQGSLLGDGLFLATALFIAASVTLAKSLVEEYGGLKTTFITVLPSLPLLLIAMLATGEWNAVASMTQQEWLVILYIALVPTALCWSLFNAALKTLGVASTSVYYFLIPVFGVIWSSVLLGETITPIMIGGLTLVAVGVRLAQEKFFDAPSKRKKKVGRHFF